MSGVRQFFSRNLIKLTPCLRPPRIYPKSDKAKLKLRLNWQAMIFSLRQVHGHMHPWARGVGPGIASVRAWQRESPGLAQFDKEHSFYGTPTTIVFCSRDGAGQSYWTIVFLFAERDFRLHVNRNSIRYSTRSFPNRIKYSVIPLYYMCGCVHTYAHVCGACTCVHVYGACTRVWCMYMCGYTSTRSGLLNITIYVSNRQSVARTHHYDVCVCVCVCVSRSMLKSAVDISKLLFHT